MKDSSDYLRVSVHGGHSGQFCHHARDSLQDVVQAYVDASFSWVGITEHMPPLNDRYRYPDEAESNISAAALQQQFRRYFAECRRLQAQFADRITLFTAFETETYPGSTAFVRELLAETRPDYIVGSVHHVRDIGIDVNRELYAAATAAAGGIEALYCEYFDSQYVMLDELRPAVVGHFDLIRIFDPDFQRTMQLDAVQRRIRRNLQFIANHDLILDFNLRGFDKTAEQYPCTPVLEMALAADVPVVPGDDSHGVKSVGRNYDRGVQVLASLGHDCQWRKPRLYEYPQ